MGYQIYLKIEVYVDLDMLNMFISYSCWNIRRKVLKCWKFDDKREITPKWVMGFTSKLQGG